MGFHSSSLGRAGEHLISSVSRSCKLYIPSLIDKVHVHGTLVKSINAVYNRGGQFLKKLWCCVAGIMKHKKIRLINWLKGNLATIGKLKADVSSVRPS